MESSPTRPCLTPFRALLYGALAVGLLDAIDAVVFFGFRGISPIRIFQSIASGLLGRPAFQGGVSTALLGAVLQFVIAFAIVAVYFVASRRLEVLRTHAVRFGLLYGPLVYLWMTFVVVPLSAAPWPAMPSLPVALNGLIGHALVVGLPSALFARAACAPSPPDAGPAPPEAGRRVVH